MNWAAAHPPYDVILSVSEGSLNIPPCGDIPFLLYYMCIFVRKGLDSHARRADDQTKNKFLRIVFFLRPETHVSGRFCLRKTIKEGLT